MEVDALVEFVSQVMPLKMLSYRACRALCEHATSRTFEPGQLICRKGEASDAFFVIISGSVQMFSDEAAAHVTGGLRITVESEHGRCWYTTLPCDHRNVI